MVYPCVENMVRTHLSPDPGLTQIFAEHLRHCLEGRPFQEILCPSVLRQKRHHFLSQRFIVSTRSLQKGSAMLGILLLVA